VVRAEDGQVATTRALERHFDTVAELGTRSHAQVSANLAVADASERDHDSHLGEEFELSIEERLTCRAFVGRRLVGGRRALDRRGDPRAAERQPVVAVDALRLIGVPGPPKRPIEPIAAAVTGEHSPGAIGAVGSGRQSDDEQPSRRGSEPRNRSTPVLLISIRGPLLACDLLSPLDQPWTGAATLDFKLKIAQWLFVHHGIFAVA